MTASQNKISLTYPGGYELPSLMALKAICAFTVIQIHVITDYKIYILPFYRIVVPIFFMISGYFLLNSSGDVNPDRIKRAVVKMIKIIVGINIIYAGYWLIHAIPKDNFSLFTSLDSWIRFILYGDTFCYALWYLECYLEALLIIWGLTQIKQIKLLYWLIPIGIILNLCFGTYVHLFSDNAMYNGFYHRNVFTIGLPCIALGMLIRRYQHRLTFSPSKILIVIVALLGLAYWECLGFLKKYIMTYGDVVITTIPLAIAVFLLFLNCDELGRCRWINSIGRRHSLNIYLIHVLIIWIMSGDFVPFPFSFFDTLVVFIIALALSEIYLFIQSKLRLSFLP